MKKRFTEEKIIRILKEHETGIKVDDICRQHNIGHSTFYAWKAKYAGMEVSEAKRLRELETENAKLKRLLADTMLDGCALKKVVKPRDKRPVVDYLKEAYDFSERHACALMKLSRSSYRYRANSSNDNQLKIRLKELAIEYPSYGYLMLHGMLKQEGLVVNKKRTYRLYTGEKLQMRTKQRKKLHRLKQPMLLPVSVNQRWSMDFISDQLSDGRRFRVLNVVDDFSRECVGQFVDTSISGLAV